MKSRVISFHSWSATIGSKLHSLDLIRTWRDKLPSSARMGGSWGVSSSKDCWRRALEFQTCPRWQLLLFWLRLPLLLLADSGLQIQRASFWVAWLQDSLRRQRSDRLDAREATLGIASYLRSAFLFLLVRLDGPGLLLFFFLEAADAKSLYEQQALLTDQQSQLWPGSFWSQEDARLLPWP